MALIGIDPIKLRFWANVLSGVLAPVLVIFLIVLGNNCKIMHDQRLSWITNLGLILKKPCAHKFSYTPPC